MLQEMLPGANITELCLNRQVVCKPHRDKANTGASYALFLGEFTGGALVLEDGARFEQRGQWMGPILGSELIHWNEPITDGRRIVGQVRPDFYLLCLFVLREYRRTFTFTSTV